MEIFKAASQMLDTSINASAQQNQTRQVENTQIQENLTQKSEDTQKSVSQTIDDELDKLTDEELAQKTRETTDKLNFQMEQLDAKVRFAYNDTLNLMVVQVKDAKTGELVSQLPSKQAIKISEYFRESIGILFDKES